MEYLLLPPLQFQQIFLIGQGVLALHWFLRISRSLFEITRCPIIWPHLSKIILWRSLIYFRMGNMFYFSAGNKANRQHRWSYLPCHFHSSIHSLFTLLPHHTISCLAFSASFYLVCTGSSASLWYSVSTLHWYRSIPSLWSSFSISFFFLRQQIERE